MLRALQFYSSIRSIQAEVGHIVGRTKEFQFAVRGTAYTAIVVQQRL